MVCVLSLAGVRDWTPRPHYAQTHSMKAGNGSGDEAKHDNIITYLPISQVSLTTIMFPRESLPLRFQQVLLCWGSQLSLTTIKCWRILLTLYHSLYCTFLHVTLNFLYSFFPAAVSVCCLLWGSIEGELCKCTCTDTSYDTIGQV